MALMQTWRDSLAVFLPRDGKLFFLVSFKTAVETSYILFTRLWWVMVLDALIFYVVHRFSVHFLGNALYAFISTYFLFFLIVLAMRPSVLKKDNHYFFSYTLYFLPLLLFISLTMAIFIGITALSFFVHHLFADIVKTLFLLHGFLIVSPLVIFFALFLLDSDGSLLDVIKSAVRSIKMVWYNYPFCLISYGVASLILAIITWLMSYVTASFFIVDFTSSLQLIMLFLLRYVYFWICVPFIIAYIVNFYVRVIYPQLNFYFAVVKKES